MIVTDFDQLAEVITAYKEFDAFTIDVETKGKDRLNPRTNEVFWVALAGPGRADVIPLGHPLGDVSHWERPLTKTGKVSLAANAMPTPVYLPPPPQLRPGVVFDALHDLLFSDRRKIGHNIKFDLCSLRKYYRGALPPPPYASTDVAAFLLNENFTGNRPYSLQNCSKRDLGFIWEKSFGAEVETHPFSIAARYGYFDAKNCWLLWRCYERALREEGLFDLFELEMDVLRVVCDMETTGVHIDVDAIKQVDRELRAEIDSTYEKIRKAAGWDINLNANAEVAKLVYEVRGHKPVMWTEKTKQPSTAAKAFEPYAPKDPIVKALIHWQGLHKTHSTFVTGILNSLTKEGKVHGSFNQRGAKTGRFSSDHPNLQNIPIRQDKTIRGMFVAPPGYALIVADYSQIELRLLAHYSQDPMLLKAYREGLDLHHITATRAYRVTEPTDRQRSLAKNVNFSMVYGGGPMTIMMRYEVPFREAEKLINAFFDTYKRVKPWTRSVIKKCKSHRVSQEYAQLTGKKPSPPYVTTILGRRRRLPQIFWTDRELRGYAERQAVNTVIQGSAGDVNKIAMVEVDRCFRHHNAGLPVDRHWQLLLTIHDELVALVPEEDAEEARAVMKEVMENLPLPVALRVPLEVDAKICRRWSDAKG